LNVSTSLRLCQSGNALHTMLALASTTMSVILRAG